MSWVQKKEYLFDILKKSYLNSIVDQICEFKVRVYIISCQNLSAGKSYVEFRNLLAGDRALCTANPYPVIKIGSRSRNNERRNLKIINESDKAVSQDLNP
jgi:hypothetical protein